MFVVEKRFGIRPRDLVIAHAHVYLNVEPKTFYARVNTKMCKS